MSRGYNFSAGPAVLPLSVLQELKDNLFEWNHQQASILEINHRSSAFVELFETVREQIRALLNVPKNYHVLLLPGGATAQFAFIPLNLLKDKTSADYVDSGYWSRLAIREAQRYCTVNIAATVTEQPHYTVADPKTWQINKNTAYLHYTGNETILGFQFPKIAHFLNNNKNNINNNIIVCDRSSDLFGLEININDFGLIYAAAQKNFGIPGLTLVIVRDDLIDQPSKLLPDLFNYQAQVKNNSMLNTPSTIAVYTTHLVLKWLAAEGGVNIIEQRNREKANLLYQTIDNSKIYYNNIDKNYRSIMNISFFIKDINNKNNNIDLTEQFIKLATKNGLVNLKGHRSLGGIRASLYNAMPLVGVKALCEFMQEFEKNII